MCTSLMTALRYLLSPLAGFKALMSSVIHRDTKPVLHGSFKQTASCRRAADSKVVLEYLYT
jgi:hypothetical protein